MIHVRIVGLIAQQAGLFDLLTLTQLLLNRAHQPLGLSVLTIDSQHLLQLFSGSGPLFLCHRSFNSPD
jgi:hypothetical protein